MEWKFIFCKCYPIGMFILQRSFLGVEVFKQFNAEEACLHAWEWPLDINTFDSVFYLFLRLCQS